MSQRRVLIGSMIGILMFTILSWVSPRTWDFLEAEFLKGRSSFRIVDPFGKLNFINISFDNETSKSELLNLVSELAAREAESISVYTSKNNPMRLDNLDLETSIGDYDSKTQVINFSDIETSNGNRWLDRSEHNIASFSHEDIIENQIPEDLISGKNILISSPNIDSNKNRLDLVLNYLDDRWVKHIELASILNFFLVVFCSILLAALVSSARIIAYFAISLFTIVFAQLAFSVGNINFATLEFLVPLTGVLILSNLFDLNTEAIKRKEIFKQEDDENTESKIFAQEYKEKSPQDTENSKADLIPVKDLKTKFFQEQEENFEDIALQFQEKTVRSVDNINEKMSELFESNQLSERDHIKLSLLKHNFDAMIEEFDAILFNLVPFRFEAESGLISILELYASKIFQLSKGKMQISIDTEFSVLRFSDLSQKVNTYRVIYRLVDLIKEMNSDKIAQNLNIAINIFSDPIDEKRMRIRLSYEGKAINPESNNFKIKEIKQRINIIPEANLDFGEQELKDIAPHLTNHIEFHLKKPLGAESKSKELVS